MTAAGTTSRMRTAHAGLAADDVTEAALALVEREGGEALTMRRLASELGVTTNTIYWHVGNRDELVLAVISLMAQRLADAEVQGASEQERVTSAAVNIWRNAIEHRNVTALASQVGATTLLELPLEVALLAELEAAGLHGPAARDGLRSILMCVAGFLIGAWRSEDRVPEELRAKSLWAGVVDDRVSEETLEAMAQPAELEPLCHAALAAVVAGLLDETHAKRTTGGNT